MEWGKMFVFALLLAGISFSAVSQAAAMEQAYGMQVCKIEYHRDLVDLTGNYIPEADKISSRDLQWYETKIHDASNYLRLTSGIFDQDLMVLEMAKGTSTFYTTIKGSNAHLRSAATLYSQFAAKYARYGGRDARLQIASDRQIATETYKECVFCVSHPNDDRCKKCSIVPDSESVSVRVTYAGVPGGVAIPGTLGDFQEVISAGEFSSSPVYPYFIENTRTAEFYAERENFVFSGVNEYDSGTDEFSSTLGNIAYEVDFVGPIPVCPGDTDKTWEECKGTGDAITSHRIAIKFLEEEWIISGIEGIDGAEFPEEPGVSSYSTGNSVLHLAKEGAHGFVDLGESLISSDGYEIRLDDISAETNENGAHPAVVKVLDSDGNELCTEQIYPGETAESLCAGEVPVKLHAYQTAPGLEPISKWAEMAIYSDEFALAEGSPLAGDDTGDWVVMIGWDSNGGPTAPEPVKRLRDITIWYAPSLHGFSVSEGDTISIPHEDGEDGFVLSFHHLPTEDPDSLWVFSLEQTPGPEVYDYNLEVGDKLEIGDSGEFIELQRVSANLLWQSSEGMCAVDEGSEVASLDAGLPDNTYSLEMGEGYVEVLQSNGIIVEVLDISEEVTTP